MNWDKHFSSKSDVLWPINDSAVEAVIKVVTYHLRTKYGSDWSELKFLEVGCGGGANLLWLAKRGIHVSGVDIAASAINATLDRLRKDRTTYDRIYEGSATSLNFLYETFDGVIEACVIQHLNKEDRRKAFAEIDRVLKPGGLFVGYCLSNVDDIFFSTDEELDDPGTIALNGKPGHLQGVGLTHFFNEAEFADLLPNFDIECLPVSYTVPTFEAKLRGQNTAYTNRYYVVYGVKRC